MPRLARVVLPGHAHHVTQWGVRGLTVFSEAADFERYLSLLSGMSQRFGLRTLAYCLMPDHLHLVVIPEQAQSLARSIGETHRRYTAAKNQQLGVRGYLFQGRFASCPLDAEHTLCAMRCVERNPVRAGLTESALGYAWSSARFNAGLVTADPVVRDRLAIAGIADWAAHLVEEPTEAAALRHTARTGRPCGSIAFIEQAEKLAGRPLRPGRPGRPRKARESEKTPCE